MNKNFFLSIHFLMCFVIIAKPQSIIKPLSASYLGLNALSNNQQDVFSIVNNQAALVKCKQAAVGIYTEQRFMLKELSNTFLTVAMPTKMGNFGININYFGFKNFNQSQIGIAYARSIGAKVAVGAQFNYLHFQVPQYDKASAVNIELGLIAHVTNKLNVGIHVYNPMSSKYFKMNEKILSTYTLGVGYDVSDKFFVSAEVAKSENYPINMNAGVQYHFSKQFFARLGLATETSMLAIGFGVAWGNMRLDISTSYHPILGVSPGLLFIYCFSKKE